MNLKQSYEFLCSQEVEDIYDATFEIVDTMFLNSYKVENGSFGFDGEYRSLSYFFYDGEFTKIGKVLVMKDGVYRKHAIKQRIKTLQNGNPRQIIPLMISYYQEDQLHRMFRKKRLSTSEWFDLSNQDFDNVQDKSIKVDEWLKGA